MLALACTAFMAYNDPKKGQAILGIIDPTRQAKKLEKEAAKKLEQEAIKNKNNALFSQALPLVSRMRAIARNHSSEFGEEFTFDNDETLDQWITINENEIHGLISRQNETVDLKTLKSISSVLTATIEAFNQQADLCLVAAEEMREELRVKREQVAADKKRKDEEKKQQELEAKLQKEKEALIKAENEAKAQKEKTAQQQREEQKRKDEIALNILRSKTVILISESSDIKQAESDTKEITHQINEIQKLGFVDVKELNESNNKLKEEINKVLKQRDKLHDQVASASQQIISDLQAESAQMKTAVDKINAAAQSLRNTVTEKATESDQKRNHNRSIVENNAKKLSDYIPYIHPSKKFQKTMDKEFDSFQVRLENIVKKVKSDKALVVIRATGKGIDTIVDELIKLLLKQTKVLHQDAIKTKNQTLKTDAKSVHASGSTQKIQKLIDIQNGWLKDIKYLATEFNRGIHKEAIEEAEKNITATMGVLAEAAESAKLLKQALEQNDPDYVPEEEEDEEEDEEEEDEGEEEEGEEETKSKRPSAPAAPVKEIKKPVVPSQPAAPHQVDAKPVQSPVSQPLAATTLHTTKPAAAVPSPSAPSASPVVQAPAAAKPPDQKDVKVENKGKEDFPYYKSHVHRFLQDGLKSSIWLYPYETNLYLTMAHLASEITRQKLGVVATCLTEYAQVSKGVKDMFTRDSIFQVAEKEDTKEVDKKITSLVEDLKKFFETVPREIKCVVLFPRVNQELWCLKIVEMLKAKKIRDEWFFVFGCNDGSLFSSTKLKEFQEKTEIKSVQYLTSEELKTTTYKPIHYDLKFKKVSSADPPKGAGLYLLSESKRSRPNLVKKFIAEAKMENTVLTVSRETTISDGFFNNTGVKRLDSDDAQLWGPKPNWIIYEVDLNNESLSSSVQTMVALITSTPTRNIMCINEHAESLHGRSENLIENVKKAMANMNDVLTKGVSI